MKDYPAFYEKHTRFLKNRERAKKWLPLLDKSVTLSIALFYLVGLILAAFSVFGAYLPPLFSLLVPLACTFAIVTALRFFIPRKRPYAKEEGAIEPIAKKKKDSGSFPSRHVACAFCIGVSLCSLALWLGIPVLVLGALLGYLRFLCGYHYPSDLLGGAGVGALLGAAAFFLPLLF